MALAYQSPLATSSQPPRVSPFPKRCRICGATYDRQGWERLPEVGYQPDGHGGGAVQRNCPCGATLTIELPLPDDGVKPAPIEHPNDDRAQLAFSKGWYEQEARLLAADLRSARADIDRLKALIRAEVTTLENACIACAKDDTELVDLAEGVVERLHDGLYRVMRRERG